MAGNCLVIYQNYMKPVKLLTHIKENTKGYNHLESFWNELQFRN